MEVYETKLFPPEEFLFPFTPYSVQKHFMQNLYSALEERKLGIFESPTGTGKSMSLICGSLKWLFDSQQRFKDDIKKEIKRLDEELKSASLGTDWLQEHSSQVTNRQKKDSLLKMLNEITSMESRIENIKVKAGKLTEEKKPIKPNWEMRRISKNLKSKQIGETEVEFDGDDDDDVLLDNYTVDVEHKCGYNSSESENESEDRNKYSGIKVFVCSRTHSQLTQLVGEVKKSPYKDLNVRIVSLASRLNYCINESVLNLKNINSINEKCQELHSKKKEKAKKKSLNGEILKKQKISGGCLYYQTNNIEKVKLKMLTQVEDIEQLVDWGKTFNGCPYYASRQAVNEAQLVLVPYNTILHKGTREAYGINLTGSVVIVDEAHNLLDAIGNIHSSSITGLQLAKSYSQLIQYRDKYNDRFSAVNLLHLNQLIFIINKLLKKVGGKGNADPSDPTSSEPGTFIESVADFVLTCEIDSINFYKLLEFIRKSNLVNKLQGFAYKHTPTVKINGTEDNKGVSAFLKTLREKKKMEAETQEKQKSEEIPVGNPVISVVSFLQSLTNDCVDGRIVTNVGKSVGASSFKYLLLNPASHFDDIVKEARSVILAGGTMQPLTEFTDQLFYLAGGTPDRISIFTCGHIVPKENIVPIIVSSGPSGKKFNFSFKQRNDTEAKDELGRLLINVCNVVPAGVVCFFSSYDYENSTYERFEQTGVIEKLSRKKKVLREPRKSSKVDQTLKDYASAVKTRGAILFSVVGGKLSEGLNFSDDLGRCVVVVGLPYPNSSSLELKEKMNYLNANVGPDAGKIYYENLCMKAVNQSIGRSVRHKNDYASVLLIDCRYSRRKCVEALPEWIRSSLRNEESFGAVMKLLANFFARKKEPQSNTT